MYALAVNTHRMVVSVVVGCVWFAGCSKKSQPPAAGADIPAGANGSAGAGDQPAAGAPDRAAGAGATNPAAEDQWGGTPGGTAAAGTTGAAPGAGAADTSCDAAMANAYAVVDASGDEELKTLDQQHPASESIANCTAEQWPASLTSCLASAKTLDDVYHACYGGVFKQQPLQVGRQFAVGATQGFGDENGDYLELSEGCGILSQSVKSIKALFVVCDGKTQGPLTMPGEIREAFAALSADEAARHNMVMNLISKTKVSYFGGDHRVCDQSGANCHIE